MSNTPPKVARKNLKLPAEIVTASSDPSFYDHLGMLPNPDPILRKLGKDSEAYQSILYDGHVTGDIRSLYSGLLGYEWRIVPGGDDPASMLAFEKINYVMGDNPVRGLRWDNFLWNIYQSILYGQSVHEIGWNYDGSLMFPGLIKDRPSRRFHYTTDSQPRIITKANPLMGEEAPDERRLLICQHMPSEANPYGFAVLSSCYWPHVFKHNGWKWLIKLAEKFGYPWPVGKYPAGTPLAEQQKFVKDLAEMMDFGAFAIPDSNEIDLLAVATGGGAGGEPIQERIINLANSEMSKALTSQTLSTEIKGGGSRAAAETHREKEQSISKTDRGMVSDTVNQLFKWTTELNWIGAKPPKFEFYKEGEPSENWVKVLDSARRFLPISKEFAYDRLQITAPKDDAELIDSGTTKDVRPGTTETHTGKSEPKGTGDHSAKPQGSDFATDEQSDPDPSDGMAVDDLLKPIKKLLNESKDLVEFQQALTDLYPKWDNTKMEHFLELAVQQNMLEGRE